MGGRELIPVLTQFLGFGDWGGGGINLGSIWGDRMGGKCLRMTNTLKRYVIPNY